MIFMNLNTISFKILFIIYYFNIFIVKFSKIQLYLQKSRFHYFTKNYNCNYKNHDFTILQRITIVITKFAFVNNNAIIIFMLSFSTLII